MDVEEYAQLMVLSNVIWDVTVSLVRWRHGLKYCGAALAQKMKKQVCCCCMGDGATSAKEVSTMSKHGI